MLSHESYAPIYTKILNILQQDGLLCAQHCLNNLLQDSLFTAVDLATIGRSLDALESAYMTAGHGLDDVNAYNQVYYR